ncbi:MAG: deoxyribose-phosphate aldolase [Woeseia sp.]
MPGDLARYIDHTLLKPEATEEQIRNLCGEAREYNFRSVCVNPIWVPLAVELLRGSDVLTCTVVGFPLGANEPEIKAMEARRAIRNGAREIDMVINIGALKSGDDALVLRDIQAVVEDCVDGNAVCKVILETALLTDAEKRRASELARTGRAHFVKTSTGFSTGGATVSDVALMAEVVRGAGLGVKASGGISSYSDAKALIEAGATRLGASASIGIVQEAKSISMSA